MSRKAPLVLWFALVVVVSASMAAWTAQADCGDMYNNKGVRIEASCFYTDPTCSGDACELDRCRCGFISFCVAPEFCSNPVYQGCISSNCNIGDPLP
jgi:hypothetical protein